jgi:endonuclease YncB( thermonuclease family)
MARSHGVPLFGVLGRVFRAGRWLVPLGLLLVVTSAVSCVAPEAGQPLPSVEPELPHLAPEAGGSLPQPEPPGLPSYEEVFSALDTEELLDIGYHEPGRVVTVEGTVVGAFYATESKGKPTFLDFHDPYPGWFTCVIWEEDRETGEAIRDRFVAAFQPNPESYFLGKRVRVRGEINIYQGTPEIELTEPSQIWVIGEASQQEALVIRVIDGDTIEIESGQRVRYTGIDAPEVAHATEPSERFGEEAAEKNRELVEGRIVSLERDVTDRDEYGRLLRYVWLGDTMINAELVRLGYAYAYSLAPNVRYQELFLRLEAEAREQQLGLWAE